MVAAIFRVCVIAHSRHQTPIAVIADLIGRSGLGIEHLRDGLIADNHLGLCLLAVLLREEITAPSDYSACGVLDLLHGGNLHRTSGSDILLSGKRLGIDDGH